jgi:DNA-binding PucR family transcriptional regulator
MARDRAQAAQATADALLRQVAVDHEHSQPELEAAILDRLRESVPEFFADDDVAYDMGAAVTANVHRVQQLLAHAPEKSMSEALPLEAGDLLQSTIQHGIPLISLLEAYRAAQGLAADWWQHKLDHTAPPALLSLATRTLNQLILTYIDTAAAQVRASYELERRAVENSPDGRRAHLIRKLLAGELLDTDAAARTLNHPLTGRHVALVLWRTDDDTPENALHDTLAEIAAATGPVRSLTTAARHRIYAWLSTSGAIDLAPARALPIPAGIHVAMSGVHTGVDGFVQSHEDAVRTAGVVRERAAPSTGRIAAYEEVELVALLSRDPDACHRFVHRVLGRLAHDTKDAERGRTTLHAFLASGSSPSRAADRLGVHRNTITYRLSALQDILAGGDDPDAPDDWAAQASRRLELELALRIVEQLGPLDPATTA